MFLVINCQVFTLEVHQKSVYAAETATSAQAKAIKLFNLNICLLNCDERTS